MKLTAAEATLPQTQPFWSEGAPKTEQRHPKRRESTPVQTRKRRPREKTKPAARLFFVCRPAQACACVCAHNRRRPSRRKQRGEAERHYSVAPARSGGRARKGVGRGLLAGVCMCARTRGLSRTRRAPCIHGRWRMARPAGRLFRQFATVVDVPHRKHVVDLSVGA